MSRLSWDEPPDSLKHHQQYHQVPEVPWRNYQRLTECQDFEVKLPRKLIEDLNALAGEVGVTRYVMSVWAKETQVGGKQ